jgi:hypothetical protein
MMHQQLDKKRVRCYGYQCNLKFQCQRFLTIEIDKKGLYAYQDSFAKPKVADGITVCSEYLEDVKMSDAAEETKVDPVSFVTRNSNDWLKLRRLAGYLQDGSHETIKLYQDDATGSYFVQVGNKSNYGTSFSEALNKFLEDGQ